MASQVTSALGERTSECESLRLQLSGGGLVQTLQTKLATAEADLTRLVAEREKLMEISNMLRADLNRVLAESFVAPSAAAATERAEREVASRYEQKLTEIEGAMKQLVGQNRTLKEELRRWTDNAADGGELLPAPGVPRRGVDPRSAASRVSAASGGGLDGLGSIEQGLLLRGATPPSDAEAHGEGGGCYYSQDGYDGEGAAEATPWAWRRGASPANEDSAGGLPPPSHFYMPPTPADSTASGAPSAERAFHRAAARRATAPPSSGLASGSTEGAAKARAKLDEARSSLQLSGSKAPQHSGPPPGPAALQSERATSSQTKARLQDIQRKRAELINKRQLVRNYNDKDE